MPFRMPGQQNDIENSPLNQPPTVPRRGSSRNAPMGVVSNRSGHPRYPSAHVTNAVIRGNQPNLLHAILDVVSSNEPWTVQGGSNRPALRINTNNIIVQSNYNCPPWMGAALEITPRPPTARAARPRDMGPQSGSVATSSNTTPQNDSPKSAPLLRRSNAIRVKRNGTKTPGIEPETLPEHPQATLINGLNRLTTKSPQSSPLPGSRKRAQTMKPVKTIVRGLAGLGKRIFSRTVTEPVKSQSVKIPRYTLRANHNGQVPLLTLEYERYLELRDPLHSEPLFHARKTLQVFRAAFTWDLPEHRFARGQAQVDIVARYLMIPFSTVLEESQTTRLVRHSAISLRAWQAYTRPDDYPPLSKDSQPYQRWNMIEARRRVRNHNRVIESFNHVWDDWVAAQPPDIQIAARREPGENEIRGGTQSPFRDFYHWMLIACDEEIKQRQDIGEALILQYPSSFPGFKGESAASG